MSVVWVRKVYKSFTEETFEEFWTFQIYLWSFVPTGGKEKPKPTTY